MGAVKLFLVEDQILTRQAFARAFAASGKYEVIGESSSSAEVASNPPTCQADVVILDLSLADHKLLEAINQLRGCGVSSPILIVANGDNGFSVHAALNAGAQGCVPKHADFDEMETAINTIARGQPYISPTAWKNPNYTNQQTHTTPTSNQILSKREHEIFLLLAEGKKNREIGRLLSISTRTVDTHRSNILKKLQVKSNAELVRMAIGEGLLGV